MRTPVRDLLGVEYPVVAFSHCRDVVAAVSRAGGFGVLGATSHTPEQLDVELRWIDEAVGDQPYGVDVLVPESLAGGDRDRPDPSAGIRALIPDEHRRFVDELLARYDVPPLPEPAPAGVFGGAADGLTAQGAMRLIEVALAHPVRLVASALGPPPPELVAAAHAQDVPVAALVGKAAHAKRQQAAGVDLIVAQGYEAGGHTGEIATMVLVPEVVEVVAPTPVLAAGGIASGRQMAAALALGAQGVWTGSVWLATREAETHPAVLAKFLAAGSDDTVRSRSLTGKPARQLKSAWTEAWDGPESPGCLPMPLQPILVADAQRRIARAAAGSPGATALANYFVGQVVGSFRSVRPARQVLHEMVEEYLDVVTTLHARLQEP